MSKPMPSDVFADWIACEDLLLFVGAASSCAAQGSFYEDGRGQQLSLDFLHEYVRVNYRALYRRSLALDINDFNRARILVELLAHPVGSSPSAALEEGALIAASIRALPPHRAWRALAALARGRVCNRRVRATVRTFMASRRDLGFDAIKYRRHLTAVAAHLHLQLPDEIEALLFHGHDARSRFAHPVLDAFRRAHYSREAVYELPMSVAEGLAAHHGIRRDVFLERIAERMSHHERGRLHDAAERADVDIGSRLDHLPPTRLASYILAQPRAARRERAGELEAALEASAQRLLARAPLELGHVAVVLDRSWSAQGIRTGRNRPLAMALATAAVLRAASERLDVVWTSPVSRDILVEPGGPTRLAEPLIDALRGRPELVVIVSDGFENTPAHGAAEVARIFRQRLDPERRTTILHLNPVLDSGRHALRDLGPAVQTVGARTAEVLPTLVPFAMLAGGIRSLAELDAMLTRRVASFLRAHGATS